MDGWGREWSCGKRVEESDEIEGLMSEELEESVKLRKVVRWRGGG